MGGDPKRGAMLKVEIVTCLLQPNSTRSLLNNVIPSQSSHAERRLETHCSQSAARLQEQRPVHGTGTDFILRPTGMDKVGNPIHERSPFL